MYLLQSAYIDRNNQLHREAFLCSTFEQVKNQISYINDTALYFKFSHLGGDVITLNTDIANKIFEAIDVNSFIFNIDPCSAK
jgi:hypothetical protein